MKKIFTLFILLFSIISITFADSQYVVTASSLNVRKYASSNSEVLFKVTKGQTVTVKEFSGSWAYIDVPKGCGWVAKKYLSKSTATTTESTSTKKLKSNRTTSYIMDEPIHKAMTWINRVAAAWAFLWFIILFYPAIKRKKLLVHIIALGSITAILVFSSFETTNLVRFISPAAIVAALLWPLLYANIKESTITFIGFALMIGACVALYYMFRVEFEGTFWVWLWTIGLSIVNFGLFSAAIVTQDEDRCPYCNYYADHPIIDSEYLDSHISSETSTRDEYSHSVTSGNVRTNYYTRYHDVKYFRNDRYRDTHRCMNCANRFTRQRTEKKQIGSETY